MALSFATKLCEKTRKKTKQGIENNFNCFGFQKCHKNKKFAFKSDHHLIQHIILILAHKLHHIPLCLHHSRDQLLGHNSNQKLDHIGICLYRGSDIGQAAKRRFDSWLVSMGGKFLFSTSDKTQVSVIKGSLLRYSN